MIRTGKWLSEDCNLDPFPGGECTQVRYGSESIKADFFGRPLKIHKCGFSCEKFREYSGSWMG